MNDFVRNFFIFVISIFCLTQGHILYTSEIYFQTDNLDNKNNFITTDFRNEYYKLSAQDKILQNEYNELLENSISNINNASNELIIRDLSYMDDNNPITSLNYYHYEFEHFTRKDLSQKLFNFQESIFKEDETINDKIITKKLLNNFLKLLLISPSKSHNFNRSWQQAKINAENKKATQEDKYIYAWVLNNSLDNVNLKKDVRSVRKKFFIYGQTTQQNNFCKFQQKRKALNLLIKLSKKFCRPAQQDLLYIFQHDKHIFNSRWLINIKKLASTCYNEGDSFFNSDIDGYDSQEKVLEAIEWYKTGIEKAKCSDCAYELGHLFVEDNDFIENDYLEMINFSLKSIKLNNWQNLDFSDSNDYLISYFNYIPSKTIPENLKTYYLDLKKIKQNICNLSNLYQLRNNIDRNSKIHFQKIKQQENDLLEIVEALEQNDFMINCLQPSNDYYHKLKSTNNETIRFYLFNGIYFLTLGEENIIIANKTEKLLFENNNQSYMNKNDYKNVVMNDEMKNNNFKSSPCDYNLLLNNIFNTLKCFIIDKSAYRNFNFQKNYQLELVFGN